MRCTWESGVRTRPGPLLLAARGKAGAEKFQRDRMQTLRGRDAFDLQVGVDVV